MPGKKLSPAEFLAQLRGQRSSKGERPADPVPTAAAAVAVLDEIDFSDLAAPTAAEVETVPEEPPEVPVAPPAANGSESKTDSRAAKSAAPRNGSAPAVAAEPALVDDPALKKYLATPDFVKDDTRLTELFERVNDLLGGKNGRHGEPFRPATPETLEETGLVFEDIERLVLKYLLSKGSGSGRQICAQVRLPYQIVDPILKQLKMDQLLAFRGTAEMGDYEFTITEFGRERARRYAEECTYFGSAPVLLKDYLAAMAAQSIAKQQATEEDLDQAFSDLIINRRMLDRLGPAINSGRGMFLFGEPGNGKTSIAERITRCFGSTIWIPRTLGIDGDILRLFDPGVHQEVQVDSGDGLFDLSGVDQRWVQIVRPTVIAGGELTMRELEVCQNQTTKICEAPLQLKSNCGTLVIDDFGRQTMPVDVLLNRWIVPLEKRHDYLNTPGGKKVQVPFDQLVVFATNLEPRHLVDEAFLRRIPYKIQARDPSEAEFRALFGKLAPRMDLRMGEGALDHLIETHYRGTGRPFRYCHARDLLTQVRNHCRFHGADPVVTPAAIDSAVRNYFADL
jgi:predicted ATPase with chaperone activity